MGKNNCQVSLWNFLRWPKVKKKRIRGPYSSTSKMRIVSWQRLLQFLRQVNWAAIQKRSAKSQTWMGVEIKWLQIQTHSVISITIVFRRPFSTNKMPCRGIWRTIQIEEAICLRRIIQDHERWLASRHWAQRLLTPTGTLICNIRSLRMPKL